MNNNPDYIKIQENMKPGCFSAHGFLGDDTRLLSEILTEDDKAVRSKGLSHEAIADRMNYFTQIGRQGLGSPVIVDNIYEIAVEEFRGIIPCPFSDSFHAHKQNTRIVNLKTGSSLIWSDLNIHMIRVHGFYEGIGSFFRQNPLEIANILGLID